MFFRFPIYFTSQLLCVVRWVVHKLRQYTHTSGTRNTDRARFANPYDVCKQICKQPLNRNAYILVANPLFLCFYHNAFKYFAGAVLGCASHFWSFCGIHARFAPNFALRIPGMQNRFTTAHTVLGTNYLELE